MSILYGYLAPHEGALCVDTFSRVIFTDVPMHASKAAVVPHLGLVVGHRGLSTNLATLIQALYVMPVEEYSFDGARARMPYVLDMVQETVVEAFRLSGDDIGTMGKMEVVIMGWSHDAGRMAGHFYNFDPETGWNDAPMGDGYWHTSGVAPAAAARFRALPANLPIQAALVELAKMLRTFSDETFGAVGGRVIMTGLSQTRISQEEIFRWSDAIDLPPAPTDAIIVTPTAPAAATKIPAATTAGLNRHQRRALAKQAAREHR